MAYESEFEEDAEKLKILFCSKNFISFRIMEVNCSAGSKTGDNYMSVVKRVILNGLDVNDKDTQLSLIIKRQIPSQSRRQLYRCDEAFCNEISAYQQVVSILEQYTDDPLFPKCYFAGKDELGEIIILEDLKEMGFQMHNRLTGMDLKHCQLVMQKLAKLHAASIAAKKIDNAIFLEKRQQINEIVYCKEAEVFYKNVLELSISESLNSLRSSNIDGCLTEPIRLIEKLQEKLFLIVQSCITNSKENLSVLCHGDLWVNNIMFQNNSDTEPSPTAVKFFDLQAMRYTSLVFDILHFIYTSTKRNLRDAYLPCILETYCLSLLANLEMQLQPHHKLRNELESLKEIFSLRNITEEYYQHILYGLAIAMWILPAVTFDPNNIPNLDQISESNPSAKELKCTQKLTPEYHSRMKDLALEFYQNGFLIS